MNYKVKDLYNYLSCTHYCPHVHNLLKPKRIEPKKNDSYHDNYRMPHFIHLTVLISEFTYKGKDDSNDFTLHGSNRDRVKQVKYKVRLCKTLKFNPDEVKAYFKDELIV